MTDNFYWDINPNSGGTGGLLLDDWVTPDVSKLNILASVTPSPTNMLNILNGNSTNNNTNTTTNSTNNTNNTTNNTCGQVVYSS